MLETISSYAFLLLIVILVAIFVPQYFGWVIGALVAGILFHFMDKK